MKFNSDEWLIMSLKLFLIILSAIISYEAGLSEKKDPNEKTPYIFKIVKHAGISVLTIAILFGLTGLLNDDFTIGEYMSEKPSKPKH